MVAFITSWLILGILVAIGFMVGKRRPVGAPLTWGQAMVAATYAFLVMFWAYGVVPHLWLTWADNELKWRPDIFVWQTTIAGRNPLGWLQPMDKGGNFPITISAQSIRDILVTLIYVALLGFQMWAWAWWQKRGQKPATDVVTSDYGRPLVKKAGQPTLAGKA